MSSNKFSVGKFIVKRAPSQGPAALPWDLGLAITLSLLLHGGVLLSPPSQTPQERSTLQTPKSQLLNITLQSASLPIHHEKSVSTPVQTAPHQPQTPAPAPEPSLPTMSADEPPAIATPTIEAFTPPTSMPMWRTGHGWGRRANTPTNHQQLQIQQIALTARVVLIQEKITQILNQLNQHHINDKNVRCHLRLPTICSPRSIAIESTIAAQLEMLPLQYPEIASIEIHIVDQQWIQESPAVP